MIEIILKVIIMKAKIPNGCEWKDEIKSPLKRKEIEFPIPQPGQKSIPKFANGQIVKCNSPGVWTNIKNSNPIIQTAASNPINFQNLFSQRLNRYRILFSSMIIWSDDTTFV